MMETTNLYTYAFLNTPDFPLNLPSGNLGQLLLINGNQLSAIVEPRISLESSQNNDEEVIKMVLVHDRVICELFRYITVLPLRFGTYFTSEDMLLSHLETHGQKYQEQINNIQGKTEYTLKLIPLVLEEPMTKPSKAHGREYFMAKKQYFEHQKSLIDAQIQEKDNLINLITEIYQSSVIVQHHGEEARLHFLVDRHDKALLLKQVSNWQEKCPNWDLILGEPLPPYHFI